MEAGNTKKAWIVAITCLMGVLATVWIIWRNVSSLPTSADVNRSPIISVAPNIVSDGVLSHSWSGSGLTLSSDLTLSSSRQATIELKASAPVALVVLYGQDPTNLTSHVISSGVSSQERAALTGLNRNFSYYYQAVVTDRDLSTVKSSIYYFKNN